MDELIEETLVDTEDGTDEFAELRAHYEGGVQLTDSELDLIADTAIGYLRDLLGFFGERGVAIDEYEGDDGELILDVSKGNLAVLIGRHGRTLDSLQLVLSSFMNNRMRFHYPIMVDIEGYKSRRKDKLIHLAKSAAARAKRQHGRVTLAPMNAYERRIVHIALVSEPNVSTHSEGVDPERRVVVTYVR